MDLGNKWGLTMPSLTSGSLASKKVAMETAGAWYLPTWEMTKNLVVDAVTLPRHKKEANIALIAHLYLLKQPKDVQKAAWEFITWFCSPENNADWAIATGYLPIRKKAMSAAAYGAYIKRMPAARAFVAGMDAARSRPFWLPTWERMGQALGKQVQKALLMQVSPAQAMAKANDEMTKLVTTGRK